MPRFIVRERRSRVVEYLIDAENEEAANQLDGAIIDQTDPDDYADELLATEQVADDEEML